MPRVLFFYSVIRCLIASTASMISLRSIVRSFLSFTSIFPLITSGSSMNAMTRIAPEHFEHTRGLASQFFCINRAQFRPKALSVNSGSKMHGILSSVSVFFRFPCATTKWYVYASWGVNDIAQNAVHKCTIFSAKDSFLIPATGNEISNTEGVSHI